MTKRLATNLDALAALVVQNYPSLRLHVLAAYLVPPPIGTRERVIAGALDERQEEDPSLRVWLAPSV